MRRLLLPSKRPIAITAESRIMYASRSEESLLRVAISLIRTTRSTARSRKSLGDMKSRNEIVAFWRNNRRRHGRWNEEYRAAVYKALVRFDCGTETNQFIDKTSSRRSTRR